jgi:hypothetical protein
MPPSHAPMHAATGALAAMLLLLVAAAPAPASAALRCYSYAVRVPNAPFGYKAGFPSWKPDCDPQYYK